MKKKSICIYNHYKIEIIYSKLIYWKLWNFHKTIYIYILFYLLYCSLKFFNIYIIIKKKKKIL